MKKAKLVVLLILLILLKPISISVYADQDSPIDELDTLSDEALQLVKSERYDDAKKILDYFSNQFSIVKQQKRTFTMDELQILTGARDEAVEVITSPSADTNERINSAIKFRLAVDAVSSGQQPLWTQMEEQVMASYREMKDAAINQNKVEYEAKLNSFLTLYQIINPSLKLDVTTAQFQKLNTLMDFLDTYRLQVFTKAETKELDELEAELEDVFNQVYEDEADPSLWWVIISTGSIIILTLSYVGWRKYLGDKEEKRRRHKRP